MDKNEVIKKLRNLLIEFAPTHESADTDSYYQGRTDGKNDICEDICYHINILIKDILGTE